MAVLLQDNKVLLSDGKVAIDEACCCATGACCVGTDCSIESENDCINMGGTYQGDDTECIPNPCETGACCKYGTTGCGDTPGCTVTTRGACESSGGIFIPGVSCATNPCGCTDFNGNPWVTHIAFTLNVSGSDSLDCTIGVDHYVCSVEWTGEISGSANFNPCDALPAGASASGTVSGTVGCSGGVELINELVFFVAPRAIGLVFGAGNKLRYLVQSCKNGSPTSDLDCGYDSFTPLYPDPTFSQAWCGWPAAAGTYNLSDTVNWDNDPRCSGIGGGSGTATWNLTVTLS
jgi:hypothetical protein